MRSRLCFTAATAAAAVVFIAGTHAHAGMTDISTGTYTLHNHPDGGAAAPHYGLRLDELFDLTPSHDVFTFDFDDEQSDMTLAYDGSTIHISGVAVGGHDVGSHYDTAHPTFGLYEIDFAYDAGVKPAAGDDDVIVDAANHANSGTITAPTGDVISLVDERGGHPFSFRFGDEPHDAGHRGFDGISGWGWLNHGPDPTHHVYASDFLFTAEAVPAPGAAAAFAIAGLAATRRRRRN